MIYQYKCPDDGTIVEIERKITEAEGEYFCPECKALCVRIYNPPTITFVGKGFYKNGG